MKQKQFSAEQIVRKLQEAQARLAAGGRIEQVCRDIGISPASYYKWRKQYGQMKLDQVRQLKDLQKENSRLKKLVADQALDIAIMKEVLTGKY